MDYGRFYIRKCCGNPELSEDIQISERDISLSAGYLNIPFQYLIIGFGYGKGLVVGLQLVSLTELKLKRLD